jgi:hypothetical protein
MAAISNWTLMIQAAFKSSDGTLAKETPMIQAAIAQYKLAGNDKSDL